MRLGHGDLHPYPLKELSSAASNPGKLHRRLRVPAAAVPIVLGTFRVVEGVADSRRLLNVVFILVVVFTLVQVPACAHWRTNWD